MNEETIENRELLSLLLRGYQTHHPKLAIETLKSGVPYLFSDARHVNFYSLWLRDPKTPWNHYFTYARVSTSPIDSTDNMDFFGARIVSWSIPIDELSSFLESVVEDGLVPPSTNLEPYLLEEEICLSYVDFRDKHSGHPVLIEQSVLEISINPRERKDLPRVAHFAIGSTTQGAYRNAQDLLRIHCMCQRWRSNYSWSRGLLISCPDTRGQIGRIYRDSPVTNRFLVELETNFIDEAQVSVIIDSSHGSTHALCTKEPGIGWYFNLPEDAHQVTPIATDSLGLMFDKISDIAVSELWPTYHQRTTSSQIEEAISEGESDTVEFKSWSVLTSTKKAKGVILRTAVAFSNSSGGRLFIGVTDDGKVDGPPAESLDADSIKISGNAQDSIEKIQSWLQEETDPTISCSAEIVYCRSGTVLVLSFEPGFLKPYSAGNGVYYLRGGASSRPAKRGELLRLLGH